MFIRKIFFFLYLRTSTIDFESFISIRKWLVNGFLGSNLKNLVVRPGVIITGFKKLKLGNDVSLNHNCFLSCDGGLEIGDLVSIGHSTSVLTTEHSYSDKNTPIKYQKIQHHSVKINNNVWIGANVTILAGVTIAEGTVIAAGAVVKDSISEKNTIIGGVPAKHIKSRV